jgi:hypothetical protein
VYDWVTNRVLQKVISWCSLDNCCYRRTQLVETACPISDHHPGHKHEAYLQWFDLLAQSTCEGQEKATRGGGGEWEPIKISCGNSAYIPKSTRCPSLLTRPRLHSHRKAIGPWNRSRNMNWCWQEYVQDWWQKLDQNSIHVLTGISTNTLRACSRNNHLRAIKT